MRLESKKAIRRVAPSAARRRGSWSAVASCLSVSSLLLCASLALGRATSSSSTGRGAAHAGFVAPAGRWQSVQEGRLLSAAAATSARGGRGGGGGLCVMRIKRLSPEERERAVADKEINEKKSQLYLSQRVSYIRRMRAQYRLQVQTALPTPKTNKAWRDWAPPDEDGQQQGGQASTSEGGKASTTVPGRVGGSSSSAGVKSVYAEEEAREELRRVLPTSLRPGDMAPLAVWAKLTHPQNQPTTFNSMRGPCQYVVVLAEPSFSTNHFFDGLKRLAIVPPELAAVVGVTVLSASEANKVAKRTGLAPHTTVLSDEGRHWLRAHKIGDRSLERAMFVLDARLGTVLAVFRDPPPGAVNELLIEVIGDWRKKMPPSPGPQQ